MIDILVTVFSIIIVFVLARGSYLMVEDRQREWEIRKHQREVERNDSSRNI